MKLQEGYTNPDREMPLHLHYPGQHEPQGAYVQLHPDGEVEFGVNIDAIDIVTGNHSYNLTSHGEHALANHGFWGLQIVLVLECLPDIIRNVVIKDCNTCLATLFETICDHTI